MQKNKPCEVRKLGIAVILAAIAGLTAAAARACPCPSRTFTPAKHIDFPRQALHRSRSLASPSLPPLRRFWKIS